MDKVAASGQGFDDDDDGARYSVQGFQNFSSIGSLYVCVCFYSVQEFQEFSSNGSLY